MGYPTIHPEAFAVRMEQHWTNTLGNVSSQNLEALWETMCKAFNGAIASKGNRWAVLQPPTGTGKTQGLSVFAAMTAEANITAEHPNGILIVTRLIEQAEEIMETINRLAGMECAVTKHSDNKITPEVMREHDILVITHAAYVMALDDLCQSDGARWSDLIAWKHGSRALTVIDEALANVIDEYQVRADDVRRSLSYITTELRQEFPSQVAALETVMDVLEAVSEITKEVATGDENRSRVVWRGVFDERITFPAGLSMTPLRTAMAGIKYDHLALKKDSPIDRARIAGINDKTLKDIQVILGKWSYYAKKGVEHSFNASQLLIPDDLPAPVVLDATAKQNFLWELLEDKADIKPIPSHTRSYSNVTLHIARASAIGKTAMINEGQKRIPRLLANLEQTIGKDRKVFLCVHKRIEHIPLKYSPEFAAFSVGHWGAIDGKNDWKDYDTAVIFGLSYRDHIWATNAFFAVRGLQEDEWLRNPKWKTYTDVRDELQAKQVTVSVVQAINRIQCRKVIDGDGNCPVSDVFIVLPKGTKGDRILEAIKDEMPNIQTKVWDFEIDGDKVQVRRNSSHEALIAFMSSRLPGETSMSLIKKELGLTDKQMETLRAALKDELHPVTMKLKTLRINFVSQGYGKGARQYLLKV